MKRCDRCRFWNKEKPEAVDADCRRYPGTPFPKMTMNQLTQQQGWIVFAFWPKMRGELWCGEYRRRPWLIPLCLRLIGKIVGFLRGKRAGKVGWYGVIASGWGWGKGGKVKVHSIPNTEGEQECPTKEGSKDIARSVGLNRDPSLN